MNRRHRGAQAACATRAPKQRRVTSRGARSRVASPDPRKCSGSSATRKRTQRATKPRCERGTRVAHRTEHVCQHEILLRVPTNARERKCEKCEPACDRCGTNTDESTLCRMSRGVKMRSEKIRTSQTPEAHRHRPRRGTMAVTTRNWLEFAAIPRTSHSCALLSFRRPRAKPHAANRPPAFARLVRSTRVTDRRRIRARHSCSWFWGSEDRGTNIGR